MIEKLSRPEITAETDKNVYHQSDYVSGHVTIIGGMFEKRGISAALEFGYAGVLDDFIPESLIVRENIDRIEPKSKLTIPFQIKLPVNCRISEAYRELYIDSICDFCAISAHLKIPDSPDSKIIRKLRIQPAKEFLAIVKAYESGFQLREQKNFRAWNIWDNSIDFYLFPENINEISAPEKELRRMRLLMNNDNSVTGYLFTDDLKVFAGRYGQCSADDKEVEKFFKQNKILSFKNIQSVLTQHLEKSNSDILSKLKNCKKAFVETVKMATKPNKISNPFLLDRDQVFFPEGEIYYEKILGTIRKVQT